MANTSPSKETTPASDAKATGSAAGEKKEEKSPFELFSEKEQKLLIAAMFCLKSGAPDIDFNKFVVAGKFNTLKTAQNSWGKIKQKLATIAPKIEEAGEAGEGGEPTTPKTPKAKATPKKRTKKADADGDDDEEASPKKKKTPAKKGKKAELSAEQVKEEAMDADE
ncbi:hypothetical protein LTR36_009339 [Oleoguttula mirabilis]|uniref:Uncharacterized protein n=1 Tax=Oleoguttula mirabilis TaxID=1507867 RepID=A0AAV9JSD5_9PEZI|nr:hypothetical protein LTR36_009339 [Oleoguttula mirabilis]